MCVIHKATGEQHKKHKEECVALQLEHSEVSAPRCDLQC